MRFLIYNIRNSLLAFFHNLHKFNQRPNSRSHLLHYSNILQANMGHRNRNKVMLYNRTCYYLQTYTNDFDLEWLNRLIIFITFNNNWLLHGHTLLLHLYLLVLRLLLLVLRLLLILLLRLLLVLYVDLLLLLGLLVSLLLVSLVLLVLH